MTDVRGINGINPPEFSSPKVRRVEPPPQAAPIEDKVEISTSSLKVAEVAAYTELAKAAPDIRLDVVERAQERVASGAYLTQDVTRAVAKKIAESL
jgi:hypothetical protein